MYVHVLEAPVRQEQQKEVEQSRHEAGCTLSYSSLSESSTTEDSSFDEPGSSH